MMMAADKNLKKKKEKNENENKPKRIKSSGGSPLNLDQVRHSGDCLATQVRSVRPTKAQSQWRGP